MSGNRILFVDDEPIIRMTLSVILQKEGFEVTTAATVAEALAHIGKDKFDVLLSDLNIGQPGDGFTVVSAMRRTQPEATTFILTGFPDFDTAIQALRSQVDDYFTKPADVKAMIAAIREKVGSGGRKPPLPYQRVSTVLRKSAEAILDEWAQAAERDPELSRIPLSGSELIDHRSILLAELAKRVDAQQFVLTEEARNAAWEHGRQRRRQGYNAHHIVTEARLLDAVISRTLQGKMLSLDMSSLISDLMHVGEGLNEQLEESVRAFELGEDPIRRTA